MTICTINASLARALSEENSGVKTLFKERWAEIQEAITVSAKEGWFFTTFHAPSLQDMTKVQHRVYKKIIDELEKNGFKLDEDFGEEGSNTVVTVYW